MHRTASTSSENRRNHRKAITKSLVCCWKMYSRHLSRGCGAWLKRLMRSGTLSIERMKISRNVTKTVLMASSTANESSSSKTDRNWYWAALTGAITTLLVTSVYGEVANCDCENPAPKGHPACTLPRISYEEFRNDSRENVWVALDGGVYDVTAFLDAHPGGTSRIEMVNGQDLAKFWAVYQLHDRPHIRALLEEYRIGNLSPCDYLKIKRETKFESYYTNEPHRPQAEAGQLRSPSKHPWNSEPRILARLTDTFFTPNDLFFVRNHNNVPTVDPDDYLLEVEENESAGLTTTTFTLDDLKTKFEKHEVISALQCAGNRQEDYVTEHRPLYVAPHWREGAIGNARWAGVRVRDVLEAAGMQVDDISLGKRKPGGKIVNFIGLDVDETGVPYGGVIPIEKALDPFGDAILAYEMNGETLPRDHGYPLRLLAPGHAGCRNVKWVSSISVTEKPSELDSGSRLDRHFAPDINWQSHKVHVSKERCPENFLPLSDNYKSDADNTCAPVRVDQGPVIQTLPVQSIICTPANRVTLSADTQTIPVSGVAWSGAGRGICRVEVSLDEGKTFSACELVKDENNRDAPVPEQGMGRNWSWTQFFLDAPIPPAVREKLRQGEKVEINIYSKAIDGDFNAQPQEMSHGWNVLGICVNHWSKVSVKLDPSLKEGAAIPPPETPMPGSPYWGDGTPNRP